ncbi:MAG: GlsB/YeaQ/YmgE family stress response membrane protein [Kurthia sp.]|nr:GlsB/YeaQ/YmgE family stress response membrane protein [Kurthia sp.]
MFSFLWYIIIGGILGWLAGLIVKRDVPGGILGNILAGIVGAWLGSVLLGDWGWQVSKFYVFPALIGSIILIFIVSFIMRATAKK